MKFKEWIKKHKDRIKWKDIEESDYSDFHAHIYCFDIGTLLLDDEDKIYLVGDCDYSATAGGCGCCTWDIKPIKKAHIMDFLKDQGQEQIAKEINKPKKNNISYEFYGAAF